MAYVIIRLVITMITIQSALAEPGLFGRLWDYAASYFPPAPPSNNNNNSFQNLGGGRQNVDKNTVINSKPFSGRNNVHTTSNNFGGTSFQHNNFGDEDQNFAGWQINSGRGAGDRTFKTTVTKSGGNLSVRNEGDFNGNGAGGFVDGEISLGDNTFLDPSKLTEGTHVFHGTSPPGKPKKPTTKNKPPSFKPQGLRPTENPKVLTDGTSFYNDRGDTLINNKDAKFYGKDNGQYISGGLDVSTTNFHGSGDKDASSLASSGVVSALGSELRRLTGKNVFPRIEEDPQRAVALADYDRKKYSGNTFTFKKKGRPSPSHVSSWDEDTFEMGMRDLEDGLAQLDRNLGFLDSSPETSYWHGSGAAGRRAGEAGRRAGEAGRLLGAQARREAQSRWPWSRFSSS